MNSEETKNFHKSDPCYFSSDRNPRFRYSGMKTAEDGTLKFDRTIYLLEDKWDPDHDVSHMGFENPKAQFSFNQNSCCDH